MQKRERILLIVTVLAVAIYLVDMIGGVDSILGMVSFNSAQVTALKAKNKEYRDQIDDIEEIQRDFRKIELLFVTRDGQDSQKSEKYKFTEKLSEIAKEIGANRPSIPPAATEAIPDVLEYEYLTVEMTINRIDEVQARDFLRLVKEENILIQQLQIIGMKDTTLVNIEVKLAKIIRA